MQDSNIVLQVVKIENTNRKSATHFALCSGLHLLGRTVIWRFLMCMEIPGLAATVCSLT